MRLTRVELARGVSVQGLTGVRSHLTESDADIRMEDGNLVVTTDVGRTIIPISNVLSLWAVTRFDAGMPNPQSSDIDDPKAQLLEQVLSSSAEFLPSPSGKKTLRPGPKKKV